MAIARVVSSSNTCGLSRRRVLFWCLVYLCGYLICTVRCITALHPDVLCELEAGSEPGIGAYAAGDKLL